MHRQEPLRLTGGLEAAHLAFALSGGLVRVLCPVVFTLATVMCHAGQQFGGSVAFELIRDQRAGNIALLLQELSEKALGRLLIAPALEQDVQDLPVLVHGPEQVLGLPPILRKTSSICQRSPG